MDVTGRTKKGAGRGGGREKKVSEGNEEERGEFI